MNASIWSDGHSGGVHPVPFRTRQLSPLASVSRTVLRKCTGKHQRCQPFSSLFCLVTNTGRKPGIRVC